MTFSWPCDTVPTTNDSNNPLPATNSVPGTVICNSHFIPPNIAMKEILRTPKIRGSERLKISPEITFVTNRAKYEPRLVWFPCP